MRRKKAPESGSELSGLAKLESPPLDCRINSISLRAGILLVNHLTGRGVMRPELLYESPLTDLDPLGPGSVFSTSQVDELMALLEQVQQKAVA